MFDPNEDIPPPPPGFTLEAPGMSAPGPVFGPPAKPEAPKTTFRTLTPEEVKAQGLNPDFAYQQDSEGKITQLGKLPDQNDTQAKTQSAMDSTRDLINSIERARGLVSNWSTGLGGAVGKMYPGSDQAKQLDTIVHQELRGNIFKNWVAQLKAQSATGTSGIGRIMQSEIPLVTGSLGALDPVAMGRDGTLQSFDQIENRVLRSAAILNNENPDDPKVLQKYRQQFLPQTNSAATPPPAGPSGSPGGPSDGGDGGPTPPGVAPLSDPQKQAYSAFLAANPKPSGDQVATFLTKLTGQTVTNGDDIAKAIASGQGASTTVENKTEQQKVAAELAAEKQTGMQDSPVTTLAKQGAMLNLSDEAAGVGNAAANLITHPLSFNPVESYQVGRDAERQRIIDARNALGYAATPIEFAGALASASPTNALASFSELPALVKQGAQAGAVGGGISGFGEGQGAQQSIAGGVVGTAGGAALGAISPYVADRITNRNALAAFAPDTPDVVNAAQAEGVDLLKPMVDPTAKGKFGALESAPGSQNVIREGVNRVKGQIEGRVGDLGQGGTALEPGAAGEKLQLSGNKYIERSRGIKNRLYSAAENAAGDTRIVPQNALDTLEAQVAELRKNPSTNAAEINFLEGLHSDLATPGGKTVAEIRNIRTGIRGAIGNSNLTMSGAEARANNVLSAAGQDISQAVPEAGRLYNRADAFYRERQTVVDDIKRSILGQKNNPLDPQTAFQNIKTLSSPGGNLRRLSAVTRYLEPDERADVAATVASTLGRKAQDAPFSSDIFLSQTDKMSPGALRTIFGPDGAQSISNLRLLSQKLKQGVGDVNQSKTANSMWRQMATRFVAGLTGMGGAAGLVEGGLHGGATGMATGAVVGGAVQGANMARNMLSARAMVSPKLTQWLSQAADVSTPSQAKQAVKGLSLVISREPALAQELAPIRDFLDQRVTQLLAANPQPNDGNNEQK